MAEEGKSDAGSTSGEGSDAGSGSSGDTGDAGQQDSGERTFSQADIERIVQERLASERRKFADYDQLKKDASEYAKIRQSQQSDLEKAQEAATKATQEAEAAKAALQESRVMQALTSEAVVAQVVDPAAAAQLIDRTALEYDEGGQPKNAKKLVEDLVKAKPWLKGKATMGSADGGAREGDAYEPGAGVARLRHAYRQKAANR